MLHKIPHAVRLFDLHSSVLALVLMVATFALWARPERQTVNLVDGRNNPHVHLGEWTCHFSGPLLYDSRVFPIARSSPQL